MRDDFMGKACVTGSFSTLFTRSQRWLSSRPTLLDRLVRWSAAARLGDAPSAQGRSETSQLPRLSLPDRLRTGPSTPRVSAHEAGRINANGTCVQHLVNNRVKTSAPGNQRWP